MNILYLIPLVALTSTSESTVYNRSDKLAKPEETILGKNEEQSEDTIDNNQVKKQPSPEEVQKAVKTVSVGCLVIAVVLFFFYYLVEKLVFGIIGLIKN